MRTLHPSTALVSAPLREGTIRHRSNTISGLLRPVAVKSSIKRARGDIASFVDLSGVVLHQNNVLQEVIEDVSANPIYDRILDEQQVSIREKLYLMRDEMGKFKATLRQTSTLIDAKYVQQSEAGLESFAGHQISETERFHGSLGQLHH